jgi:hypothetical protein
MKTRRASCLAAAILLAAGSSALAQNYRAEPLPAGQEPVFADDAGHDMDWNTTDSGGGRLSDGGALTIEGTVGQSDAGDMIAGGLTMAGGYWVTLHTAPPCYANCDQSTIAPALNVLDFNCFLNRFASNDPYANCDGSTIPPVLNVLDFNCFLNSFASGCP